MEPVAFAVDKVKGFLRSTEDFAKGLFHKREKSNHYNPIEILKRLQRETFSDIMKLRDRQEKVERMLSFYKSTKGSPFQEFSTHVHGMVDVAGALLLVDKVDQESRDTLSRAGLRTGINSRFTFETTVRKNDSLIAEFGACENDESNPLSLARVMYSADLKDWLSAVLVPWGARCKDVAITSNPFQPERSLTDFSSLGPPILNQLHGAALGLMVKRTNIAASLAELVSGMEPQPDSFGTRQGFSTFGQVIYQLSKGTTLTLLGRSKRLNTTSQQINLPKFTIPFGSLKPGAVLDASVEAPNSAATSRNAENKVANGSVALILESELDESTRVGGWIEMQNSNSRCLQWAISMSDTPEDELGWGLSLGGMIQGPFTWDHFQVEAFAKINTSKRCSFQPGIVYMMDGTTRLPALMLRSSWSL